MYLGIISATHLVHRTCVEVASIFNSITGVVATFYKVPRVSSIFNRGPRTDSKCKIFLYQNKNVFADLDIVSAIHLVHRTRVGGACIFNSITGVVATFYKVPRVISIFNREPRADSVKSSCSKIKILHGLGIAAAVDLEHATPLGVTDVINSGTTFCRVFRVSKHRLLNHSQGPRSRHQL